MGRPRNSVKPEDAETTEVTFGDNLVEVRFGDEDVRLHIAEYVVQFEKGVARVEPSIALVLKREGFAE